MSIAKGVEIGYKNGNGYVPLYPYTTSEQVINWIAGEAFGPYVLTIPVSAWDAQTRQATLPLSDIISSDIPICNKVLTGTKEQKITQDKAYSLLDSKIGIESLEGQVRFTCTKAVPTVGLTVQINWER